MKRNDYYLLVGGMVLVCCIPRRGWLFVGGFTALAFGIGWIVMPKRILTVEVYTQTFLLQNFLTFRFLFFQCNHSSFSISLTDQFCIFSPDNL